MKIVGFAQMHNELEKGNLSNWFSCMQGFCEEIYIYDQASTDGSLEYYKKFDNVHVIESPINDFSNELICKNALLKKLLEEQPDTDWIFWMDGDTLLDGRLLENDSAHLFYLMELAEENNVDALVLGHYNLWRSDCRYRTDDMYHGLMSSGYRCFWKNNGNLEFPEQAGLHQAQCPIGSTKVARTPYNLIHRGFATDYQILKKYECYKSRGQNGWALDRLLNEEGLVTEELPLNELPEWFVVTDSQDPANKERIRDIYEKQNS